MKEEHSQLEQQKVEQTLQKYVQKRLKSEEKVVSVD